jgi:hypothetical protein
MIGAVIRKIADKEFFIRIPAMELLSILEATNMRVYS